MRTFILLQGYIWDANRSSYHTSVLHFAGALKQRDHWKLLGNLVIAVLTYPFEIWFFSFWLSLTDEQNIVFRTLEKRKTWKGEERTNEEWEVEEAYEAHHRGSLWPFVVCHFAFFKVVFLLLFFWRGKWWLSFVGDISTCNTTFPTSKKIFNLGSLVEESSSKETFSWENTLETQRGHAGVVQWFQPFGSSVLPACPSHLNIHLWTWVK